MSRSSRNIGDFDSHAASGAEQHVGQVQRTNMVDESYYAGSRDDRMSPSHGAQEQHDREPDQFRLQQFEWFTDSSGTKYVLINGILYQAATPGAMSQSAQRDAFMSTGSHRMPVHQALPSIPATWNAAPPAVVEDTSENVDQTNQPARPSSSEGRKRGIGHGKNPEQEDTVPKRARLHNGGSTIRASKATTTSPDQQLPSAGAATSLHAAAPTQQRRLAQATPRLRPLAPNSPQIPTSAAHASNFGTSPSAAVQTPTSGPSNLQPQAATAVSASGPALPLYPDQEDPLPGQIRIPFPTPKAELGRKPRGELSKFRHEMGLTDAEMFAGALHPKHFRGLLLLELAEWHTNQELHGIISALWVRLRSKPRLMSNTTHAISAATKAHAAQEGISEETSWNRLCQIREDHGVNFSRTAWGKHLNKKMKEPGWTPKPPGSKTCRSKKAPAVVGTSGHQANGTRQEPLQQPGEAPETSINQHSTAGLQYVPQTYDYQMFPTQEGYPVPLYAFEQGEFFINHQELPVPLADFAFLPESGMAMAYQSFAPEWQHQIEPNIEGTEQSGTYNQRIQNASTLAAPKMTLPVTDSRRRDYHPTDSAIGFWDSTASSNSDAFPSSVTGDGYTSEEQTTGGSSGVSPIFAEEDFDIDEASNEFPWAALQAMGGGYDFEF